jgi:RNA polymerase sigma-70 factor, ECF subfamily
MSVLTSPAGFSAAYRDHYPLAFSAAYRVLGDAGAAEDVVQDVFTALWRAPRKFEPGRGSLQGYVAMMARSRAVDRVRSRNAGSAAVDRLAVRDAVREEEGESAAESVVRREDATRILSALTELPAAQREAVLMAYGRDLSTAEIAKAAGVPLGTAKSRLRLGLQRARQAVSSPAAA